MKQLLLSIFLILAIQGKAQEDSTKWQIHAGIGQYSSTLLVPSFNPIHLGINLGADYQWNKNPKNQIIQSFDLTYVNHRYLQNAVQLYTEAAVQINLDNGLRIRPLSIGGGYVLSILDLTTVEWNPDTEDYAVTGFTARNNWMISFGASLGYQTNLKIAERPVTFFLDYRIFVQGVLIEQTSPLLAYSPLKMTLSLPLSK